MADIPALEACFVLIAPLPAKVILLPKTAPLFNENTIFGDCHNCHSDCLQRFILNSKNCNLAAMKTCTHCHKDNPDDFNYCRYCGADLTYVSVNKVKSFWKKIPAWAWIIIIVAAVAGILFALIGSFIAVTTIEGIASIVLLVLGIIGFGVAPLRKPENPGSFTRAIGLSFFALMGATVDQTGNIIYNQPVEMCFCDEGTSLNRDENISNPMPGTTIVQQDFTCFDDMGNPVKSINMFAVLGIRFLEYVLLGYLLIAIRSLIWKLRNNT